MISLAMETEYGVLEFERKFSDVQSIFVYINVHISSPVKSRVGVALGLAGWQLYHLGRLI